MNEYFKTLQNISKSIDEILIFDEISQEMKESASELNKSVEPCVKEIQQSASKLKILIQGCFNDLYYAEDVWDSKQRIAEVATLNIWEQIGDLSGFSFRISNLISQYKNESLKQVKESWYKRVTRLKNVYYDARRTKLVNVFFFDKNKFKTDLNIEIQSQITEIKIIIRSIISLLINAEDIKRRRRIFNKYVKRLDIIRKSEINAKLNSFTESIFNLVERAFGEQSYILSVKVNGLMESMSNTAEALAYLGVGISREMFTECCEKIAIKLEKIVVVIFDELIRLVTQGIEQAIAFYNDFLEQQARYQQETPEQRQAEKAWIDQQRLQLAQVQSGIEAILNPVTG